MANRSRIIRGKTFEDIVECQICGFKIKNTIQSHIRFSHPEISCKEYVVKYDAEIMSEEARNRKSELMKGKGAGRVQSEKERKVRSDKNKKFYEEHPEAKEVMGARQKALYDSGEHPLFREEVRQQRREWMTVLNKTEKQRAIVSNYMKNEYVWSEESKRKMSESTKGRIHSVESRRKMSDTRKQRIADGEYSTGGSIKGYFHSNKMNKDFSYRSDYELIFYQLIELDDSVLEYDCESIIIPYELNGEKHSYFPDVLINKKELIEINSKMVWILNEEKKLAKAAAARKYCEEHDLTYRIIYEDDLGITPPQKYPKYVENYVFPRE